MDLLFEHERYNDLLEVYRIRSIERQRKPTFTHRICFDAACYKLVNIDHQRRSNTELNLIIFIAEHT